MAFDKNRDKLKQAFSIKKELENSINNSENNIYKDSKFNINIDIPVKEKPVQTLIYLDKDLKEKLDYYGNVFGRGNGGKSRVVTEALKIYFNELDKKYIYQKQQERLITPENKDVRVSEGKYIINTDE